MAARIATIIAFLALASAPVMAQHPGLDAAYVGAGNVFGGLGALAEFLLHPRLSATVGLGVAPQEPRPIAPAVAVRHYMTPARHRAFLQLSLTPLEYEFAEDLSSSASAQVYYGPGVSFGYAYMAGPGFTWFAAVGAGWVLRERHAVPMAQVGVGYAFTR